MIKHMNKNVILFNLFILFIFSPLKAKINFNYTNIRYSRLELIIIQNIKIKYLNTII